MFHKDAMEVAVFVVTNLGSDVPGNMGESDSEWGGRAQGNTLILVSSLKGKHPHPQEPCMLTHFVITFFFQTQ